MIPTDVEQKVIEGLTSGKRGLWVFGPRCSGTTTAVKMLYQDHKDVFPNYNVKRTAAWVERKTHELWKLDGLLKANGTDFPLWEDADKLEHELNDLWQAEALWIDDLYPETSSTFVRMNMLPRMDEALKDKRIVLVSGSCRPDAYGMEWSTAISTMYEVIEFG